VLSAISVVIENFESLSRFAAGVERLDTLAIVLSGQLAEAAPKGSTIRTQEAPHLALDDVTLQTPGSQRTLVQKLSIAIRPGEGLMIVGQSGSGKSSLLRAIAGLWQSGSGTILRPPPRDIFFLPQQPYMLIGSLRAQLLYPNNDTSISDEQLLEVLEQVNLTELASRFGGLDVELDWEKVLSVGEQQRLAFARVLLARPRFAILDEATSALDPANEAALYRQLQETGTTLVSVAHRASILKYHTQVLELTGNCGWATHPASRYRFSQ